MNQQQWASALLQRLNIPQTQGSTRAVVGWAKAEGGHWNNSARFNPLNTTQPAPGAGNTGTQGNIKVYKSWDQGLNATVQTLRNGRYGNILAALKAGNPAAVGQAIEKSPWGTGGLAAKVIAATPNQNYATGFKNPSVSSPNTGYASPSTDNRTALALPLLGEGGGPDPLTSILGNVSSSYGVDPLQLAITAALQRQGGTAKTLNPPSVPSAPNNGKPDLHTTYVDGKPVVGWIANILKQAKAAGWKGTVTSGERTKSQQLAAAQHFGLQHYPNGPLASNHVVGHDGAVDVSDPNGLKAVLQKLGITQLKSSMANDVVHFSRTGF